jgi:hypothetical protein
MPGQNAAVMAEFRFRVAGRPFSLSTPARVFVR